jgi:hypothetical protein
MRVLCYKELPSTNSPKLSKMGHGVPEGPGHLQGIEDAGARVDSRDRAVSEGLGKNGLIRGSFIFASPSFLIIDCP